MNLDKVKKQLAAILAKTTGEAGTTEEEARNALAFARRMMLRHQLTEADIGPAKAKTPHEIAADTEYDEAATYTDGATYTKWQGLLAMALQELIGTVGVYVDGAAGRVTKRKADGSIVYDRKGQPVQAHRFIYYGPAEDVRDARELFEEWQTLVMALARAKHGGAFRGPGRSYAEGFCNGLYRKVRDMRQEERALVAKGGAPAITVGDAALVAAAEAEGQACSALVVAGALQVMDAKRAKASDWLRGQRPAGFRLARHGAGQGGRYYGDAYQEGLTDGRKADVSRRTPRKLGEGS